MKIKETQVTTTIKDEYYLMYKDMYVQAFRGLSGDTTISLSPNKDPDYSFDNEGDVLRLISFLKGNTIRFYGHEYQKIEFNHNIEDKDELKLVRVIEENKVTIIK